MVRSILSVVAGIAVLTAASFAIEAVLNPLLLWMFPEALPGPAALSSNPWVRTLMFAYGSLSVAAGGFVTAHFARRLPVQHSAAMGIVQTGLTMIAMLSPVASHASPWVWIVTAILTIPSAMAGGVAYKRRKPNPALGRAPVSA